MVIEDDKISCGRLEDLHAVKGRYYSWPLIVLFLLLILLSISCQLQPAVKSPAENLTENIAQKQEPTIQSGFEIPESNPVQFGNYDSIIGIPGGKGLGYRGPNFPPSTEVVLGDGFHVVYREYIETKAGQIRYNLVETRAESSTGMENHQVSLRLTNLLGDFRVKKVIDEIGHLRAWYKDYVTDTAVYYFVLMIEIPPGVKPGDYKLEFLVFIDNKYYSELPCVIHVIE